MRVPIAPYPICAQEGAAARPASFRSLSPRRHWAGRRFLLPDGRCRQGDKLRAQHPHPLSPHLLFMQEKPLEVVQVDSRGVRPVSVAALGERDGV